MLRKMAPCRHVNTWDYTKRCPPVETLFPSFLFSFVTFYVFHISAQSPFFYVCTYTQKASLVSDVLVAVDNENPSGWENSMGTVTAHFKHYSLCFFVLTENKLGKDGDLR